MRFINSPSLRQTGGISNPFRRTPRVRGLGRLRGATVDPRFWAGVGVGLGLGGVLHFLVNPVRASQMRARLRGLLRPRRSSAVIQIEESVVVDVPVRIAYDQWTQFEQFPQFMQGVNDVKQVDDRRLHWKAEIAGHAREWDAEITEQVPDQRIAWHSPGGPTDGGVVTFHYLTGESCKVMMQMDYEPEGAAERIGEAVGLVRRRVRGDLERFRDFIEARGEATGAFRGKVSKEKQKTARRSAGRT